jgi:hypothetical protein
MEGKNENILASTDKINSFKGKINTVGSQNKKREQSWNV